MNCSAIIPPWHDLVIMLTLTLFAILLVFSIGIISIHSVEAKYVFSKKWGNPGSGIGQFQFPLGIAVDSSGVAYVADSGNGRIQKFKFATPCPTGSTQIISGVCFVKAWGTLGSAIGQFNFTSDVAIDSSGKVYVADTFNHRIQVFTGNGGFITKWGSLGSGDGQFDNPRGVAIDSSGSVYVADARNNRIQKFQLSNLCPAGTKQVVSGVCFVTKWGTFGHANGQFNIPIGIHVDSSGIAYISDAANDRIQMFTKNGIFIKSWGSFGTGDGQFDIVNGIDVDRFGYVYVVDAVNFRIQKFQLTPNPCPEGTTEITFQVCFVTKWGSPGTGDGQFSGLWDIDTALSKVYVIDYSNNRVQEFTWKTDVGGTGGAGGGTSPKIAVK